MSDVKTHLKIIFTIIISFLEHLIGGLDTGLKTLLAFMVADVVTGVRKAYLGKSEKSSKGYLNSEIMRRGGIKKMMVIVVIYVATVTGELISPGSQTIRNLTVSYYIATEALSILENAAACGLVLPNTLLNALENLKNDDPS